MSDPRPLGIDLSANQGMINAEVIAAHDPKVLFCGIRASISWGKKDEFFPLYWEKLGRVGLYRCAYHIIWPKQNAQRQMDNFYAAAPELGELPRVLDLEVKGDGNSDPEPASPAQQAATLRKCSDIILSRDGHRPIIYSRYRLVNDWLTDWPTSLMNEHWWWLAQYRRNRIDEHAGPPTVPHRVEPGRILIHQTADKAPGFGVSSPALDRDRWLLGGETGLHLFVGVSPPRNLKNASPQ